MCQTCTNRVILGIRSTSTTSMYFATLDKMCVSELFQARRHPGNRVKLIKKGMWFRHLIIKFQFRHRFATKPCKSFLLVNVLSIFLSPTMDKNATLTTVFKVVLKSKLISYINTSNDQRTDPRLQTPPQNLKPQSSVKQASLGLMLKPSFKSNLTGIITEVAAFKVAGKISYFL